MATGENTRAEVGAEVEAVEAQEAMEVGETPGGGMRKTIQKGEAMK